jgi:hypothetical protein
MVEGEGPRTFVKKVPAASRATFNMKDDIGAKSASMEVSSDRQVICERAMYRNDRRQGHDSIGTTDPAPEYNLAEGTTDYGFSTYVLVQNPNDVPTEVTLTYMTPEGAREQPSFRMEADSRKTVKVNDVAGMEKTDFSTRVRASDPIVAERAMYWGAGSRLGEASHDSIGLPEAHTSYYLPDGQTSGGRETYTLIQNPDDRAVTLEISYLTVNGQGNVVRAETIPAGSRRTYDMLDHSGITGRASVVVTSKTPGGKIIVERAMYWNSRGAGTGTIGGYGD